MGMGIGHEELGNELFFHFYLMYMFCDYHSFLLALFSVSVVDVLSLSLSLLVPRPLCVLALHLLA